MSSLNLGKPICPGKASSIFHKFSRWTDPSWALRLARFRPDVCATFSTAFACLQSHANPSSTGYDATATQPQSRSANSRRYPMSIAPEDVLPFINRALEGMLQIVEMLGDARVNQRPPL